MTTPLPGAWQFVPNEVPPATFQAVKPGSFFLHWQQFRSFQSMNSHPLENG